MRRKRDNTHIIADAGWVSFILILARNTLNCDGVVMMAMVYETLCYVAVSLCGKV